jgi:hypothetical protein
MFSLDKINAYLASNNSYCHCVPMSMCNRNVGCVYSKYFTKMKGLPMEFALTSTSAGASDKDKFFWPTFALRPLLRFGQQPLGSS